MQLLDHNDLHNITKAVDGNPLRKQTSNDERSTKDLQMGAARATVFAERSPRAEAKTGSISPMSEERRALGTRGACASIMQLALAFGISACAAARWKSLVPGGRLPGRCPVNALVKTQN
jgi:hypothetical protein